MNPYILCGRITAPVIRTAFATNAMKRSTYQSQRTVSFLDEQDGANDQQEVLQDQGKHQFKY